MLNPIILPPLSLYIHIPWCVQKCPYCDFNSHTLKHEIPEQHYIDCLLTDLTADLHYVQGRPLHSIFIGGGTPSLFSAESIHSLLQRIEQLIPFSPNIEITLEANPGTAEASRFVGYHQAGVNRISIGIQSFDDRKLQRLGRIHSAAEAKLAVSYAKNAQLQSFNLDLMHSLPDQTPQQALEDLQQAIALSPPHLSWYQLTIEPNTLFASRPPQLPDDDQLWEIFTQGHQLLLSAGYQQYETSAYAKAEYQCQHNLNYWRFGDYLAIGCGGHAKISFPDGRIIRYSKTKHPKGYLQGNFLFEQQEVKAEDRPFEFFMNRFRLLEPVPKRQFEALTGLSLNTVKPQINLAIEKGYILDSKNHWQITDKGKLFLNELLEVFLD
ncbi:YggW family oxidoreductase [Mergibacter septicus]|uniref:Heme chaperone HemW n=1 Tax=Mergibacter septicus TaxID=221402 RepID=A0A8D4IXR2_9PAST|nr:radical SAM family heme chaperone HemW [Mergibacter septicus]AWX15354.1 YggW family oxidoreductase [Mergibacter septicus]QDJ14608.1 YggW family oxidoreductase [Mergibacter septicus]UTU47958.1 radical SAM family heme chaperone HemW [Mergibacter septicus]WMR96435.1 radical SAM family heme chaperone HemW [Mergibacter septicus]